MKELDFNIRLIGSGKIVLRRELCDLVWVFKRLWYRFLG